MKRIIATAALFTALIGFGPVANASLVVVNGPSAFNVDTAAPTLVNVFSPTSGTIQDLNLAVNLNGIGYDLSVLLRHIDTGTTVTIWLSAFGPGGNLNGFNHTFGTVNTLFDDEAGLNFHPNYSSAGGSFRPVGLLSAFDGEDIFGTWQLSIQNTGCCTNEGNTLSSWSIQADVPEPATLALFGLALLGAGFSRRRSQA